MKRALVVLALVSLSGCISADERGPSHPGYEQPVPPCNTHAARTLTVFTDFPNWYVNLFAERRWANVTVADEHHETVPWYYQDTDYTVRGDCPEAT